MVILLNLVNVGKVVNRRDDITVCLPGTKIEDIAEKEGQVMGDGTRGAVLVHVGTSNGKKEGTSVIVCTGGWSGHLKRHELDGLYCRGYYQ